MALEDSYNLIKQMAADSDEAEMMKEQAARERAEQQSEVLKPPSVWNANTQAWEVSPPTWEEMLEGLKFPQQPPSQETDMER